MIYFAIRQISTGYFMPNYGSRKGRGGWTNDEPQPLDIPPRLFLKRHTAQAALREWLKGVTYRVFTRSGSWEGDDDEKLISKPRASRVAGDMEIVAVKLSTGNA